MCLLSHQAPSPLFSHWCLALEVLEGKAPSSHVSAGGELTVLNMARVSAIPLHEQFRVLPPQGTCGSISIIHPTVIPLDEQPQAGSSRGTSFAS